MSDDELQRARDREYSCVCDFVSRYFSTQIDDLNEDRDKIANRVDLQFCVSLLRELESIESGIVREYAISTLLDLPRGSDGTSLTRYFDQERDWDVRWRIADVLWETRATGIEKWLRKKFKAKKKDKSYEMLILAASRCLPAAEGRRIAYENFEEFPLHSASALKEVGDAESLEWIAAKKQEIQPIGVRKRETLRLLASAEKGIIQRLEKQKSSKKSAETKTRI